MNKRNELEDMSKYKFDEKEVSKNEMKKKRERAINELYILIADG